MSPQRKEDRPRKHPGTAFGNWTDADKERLLEMAKERKSGGEIALALGRSKSAVKQQLAVIRGREFDRVPLAYEDDADPAVIWICDEMLHQKLSVNATLKRAKVPSRRFWDLRYRAHKPYLWEIRALLSVLGYNMEFVPNGPGKSNA